ncbi:MAG TPA: hypothetical protein VFQ52_10225, partial [Rhizomicrobium sp.]|nr:hypothetical protein [Rhizomicrobium sp.]
EVATGEGERDHGRKGGARNRLQADGRQHGDPCCTKTIGISITYDGTAARIALCALYIPWRPHLRKA